MITPSFSLTSTERVLPKLALDFTTASLDPRITFTRTTSASNPATYINSSGTITAATNNQPRFDYDPVTLLCKGLLIEESRTNSLLNTDLLSTQVVTVTAAVRTLSFYGTGSVTLSGAHTAVVSGTGAYPTRTTYSFTPTAGALTLAVTGAVQYAQLEAGAFATSYIPTTTTALTRNADVATMTGTNFSSWYNQIQGTFVSRHMIPVSTGQANGVYAAQLAATPSTNYIGLRITAAGVARNAITNTSSVNLDAMTTTYGATIHDSLAYAVNNSVAAANANNPVTSSSVSIPTTDYLSLGSISGVSSYLNGYLKTFYYYPQRLTNAEVQAFSK